MASVPGKMHYWINNAWTVWDGSITTTAADTITVSGIKLDASTNAQTTITYEHHEIHDEMHYYVCGFMTLNDGDSLVFSVSVPDTSREAHMTFVISGQSETEIFIAEGAELSGGDAVTARNNDRNRGNGS